MKRVPKPILVAVTALAVLSTARVLAGAPDLTSSDAFGAALRLALPIALAGFGGLVSERAGIINIGLEGMMILGTVGAGYAGWHWGPWAALGGGLIGGALGGLLHALATVTFGVDHVISGVAISTFLAPGGARFFASAVFADGGGGSTGSPPVDGELGRLTAPVLAGGRLGSWGTPDALGWLENHHWFFVSDLAGLFRGLVANVGVATIALLAVLPVVAYVLFRTRLGLRIRSVGESPTGAESLGLPVGRLRYMAVTASGALAGLGGAFLVLETTRYREGQTAGRGFLGLASLIFGNWVPAGVGAGASLFGYADAIQLRSSSSVIALLAVAAIVGVLLAGLGIRSRSRGRITAGVLIAVVFGALFATVDTIPSQFVYFTPYVTTLFLLAVATQRLRPPEALGRPWRKRGAI